MSYIYFEISLAIDINSQIMFLNQTTLFKLAILLGLIVLKMTMIWAFMRLKSPATRLFVKELLQNKIDENIEAP